MKFADLKRRSGAVALEKLGKLVRFNIGQHKQSKLNGTLGTRRRSTLLTDSVSATHQKRLFNQFFSRWGKLSKTEIKDRLRFWTVLGSLAEVDEADIFRNVSILENQIKQSLKKVKGVEVIGVFEIEIINFKVMDRIADQLEAGEARKLFVLDAMMGGLRKSLVDPRTIVDSYALVHFHGIIDFGKNPDLKEIQLRDAAKQIWIGSHRVELTRFHTDKTIRVNLQNLSKYLVKGGNENLIYKIGFGWDSVENMERQMLKQGKGKLGPDFEGFENELSLTGQEIKVLGTAIDNLMGRSGSRNFRNGYLFKYGQQLDRRKLGQRKY